MARTRTRRLTRLQRRRLRNPLPPDQYAVTVPPEMLEDMKARLREVVAGTPPEAERAYRRWLTGKGQKAPYFLALQVFPAAASHPAFKMDAGKVAQKLLALEEGDPLAEAYPTWMADTKLMDAIEALMVDIEQMRQAAKAAQADIAAATQERLQEQQAEQAERQSRTASNITPARRAELLALLDLAKAPFEKALREQTFTVDEIAFLSQQFGKVGRAKQKGWNNRSMKSVRGALNRARAKAEDLSGEREQPDRREQKVDRVDSLTAIQEAMERDRAEAAEDFAGFGRDEGVEEEPDEEDVPDEDPGLEDPKTGIGSEGWDPSKMSATSTALGKRIRGSIQREDAKKARLEGFDRYLLKYRRPQARDRSRNLNAPVLYSPPEDVMAKIEEIMATPDYSNRQGLPQQFQDVLVYVLTSDHLVGRSRVIPAGSVEVYNKGTLVGTFGKSEYKTNLKQALLYAGTLVGADLRTGKFSAHKGSRMRSRVLLASQGAAGFRLITPSLAEVLRSTPVEIEIGLDQMYSDGTSDFGTRRVSNPRRAPVRSVGRTRYVPTANGYRILNGKHSGRHYTVNDFGHACKLALLLDHL